MDPLCDALLWSSLLGLTVLIAARPFRPEADTELAGWMAAASGIATFLVIGGGILFAKPDVVSGGTGLLSMLGGLFMMGSIVVLATEDPPRLATSVRLVVAFATAVGGLGGWLWLADVSDERGKVAGIVLVLFSVVGAVGGIAWKTDRLAMEGRRTAHSSGERPVARDVLSRLHSAHEGGGELSPAHPESGSVSVVDDRRGRLSRPRS